MESIFHEQQDGSLCAQHCLNALLQSPIFTAVDLGEIAAAMDTAEHEHMAAGGVETEEYRRFVQQGSSNMDDSGFFSVQVLSQALKVWDLELVPLTKRDHPMAQQDVKAYICNFREHWFTIRRLGNQWFNLNSLLSGPELISESYLALLLAQLSEERYTIFVVSGNLPPCEADTVLAVTPAVQRERPRLLRAPGRKPKQHSGSSGGGGSSSQPPPAAASGYDEDDDTAAEADADLRRALELSRRLHDSHDVSLQRALAETRPPGAPDVGAAAASAADDFNADDDEELRRALEMSRLAAIDEEELRRAVELSLMQDDETAFEQQAAPQQPQQLPQPLQPQAAGTTPGSSSGEDVRQLRAKFLQRVEQQPKSG